MLPQGHTTQNGPKCLYMNSASNLLTHLLNKIDLTTEVLDIKISLTSQRAYKNSENLINYITQQAIVSNMIA